MKTIPFARSYTETQIKEYLQKRKFPSNIWANPVNSEKIFRIAIKDLFGRDPTDEDLYSLTVSDFQKMGLSTVLASSFIKFPKETVSKLFKESEEYGFKRIKALIEGNTYEDPDISKRIEEIGREKIDDIDLSDPLARVLTTLYPHLDPERFRKYKTEGRLRSFFEKYLGKATSHGRINHPKFTTRIGEIDKPLRPDGYWEKYSLVLEYHGKQHYKYVPYFHRNGPEDLVKQQIRDQALRDHCKINDIDIIEIPYWETDKHSIEEVSLKFLSKWLEKTGRTLNFLSV